MVPNAHDYIVSPSQKNMVHESDDHMMPQGDNNMMSQGHDNMVPQGHHDMLPEGHDAIMPQALDGFIQHHQYPESQDNIIVPSPDTGHLHCHDNEWELNYRFMHMTLDSPERMSSMIPNTTPPQDRRNVYQSFDSEDSSPRNVDRSSPKAPARRRGTPAMVGCFPKNATVRKS